jgi:hypothetical protein
VEAFRSLQEAVKHSRQNWRIWENLLVIAMDVGEYQYAIYALDEILELKTSVDIKVLEVINHLIL